MGERVVIHYQFPKARLVRGAWVSLIVERRNGKTRRLKGLLLNTPRLFIQRADGMIVDIPVSRVVEVEVCLSPKAARERMIRERAYQLAKEMLRQERLIARYDAFLISRLRKKGRLPD